MTAFVGWMPVGLSDPDQIGDLMASLASQVMPAVTGGDIRPVIALRFPMSRVSEAVEHARDGQPLGKVILTT